MSVSLGFMLLKPILEIDTKKNIFTLSRSKVSFWDSTWPFNYIFILYKNNSTFYRKYKVLTDSKGKVEPNENIKLMGISLENNLLGVFSMVWFHFVIS